MTVTTSQSQAMAETTKRLLAQLANEGLVSIHLLPPLSQSQTWSCVLTAKGSNTVRRAQVALFSFTSPLSRHHWRPNDFQLPVFLDGVDHGVQENDPGAVFQFFAPGFACDAPTKEAITRELRNCSAMSSLYHANIYIYIYIYIHNDVNWLMKRR